MLLKSLITFFLLSKSSIAVTLDDNAFQGFNEESTETEEDEAVEVVSVKNDKATITWTLPEQIAELTTKQRLMIVVRPGESTSSASVYSVTVRSPVRTYTFDNLAGNTSYRASVEAFAGDRSLWYSSNMLHTSLAGYKLCLPPSLLVCEPLSVAYIDLDWLPAPKDLVLLSKSNTSLELSWSLPLVVQGTTTALINQHFLNVFEHMPVNKGFVKRTSHSLPLPMHSFTVPKLSPGTIYNITLQAGTSFGYGKLAWTAQSTLSSDEDVVLSLRDVTPNSIVLSWPVSWLSTPLAKCTIRAKSILAAEGGIETELVSTSVADINGKFAEFFIRNLRPATAYNISVTTSLHETQTATGRYLYPLKKKIIWGVFSTLVQGEYTVTEPRVVVETDYAASFVWHPLMNLGEISYQIRYQRLDEDSGDNATYTHELTEDNLRCPKFGCTWMCALLFNLPRKPRELVFFIRAKVDGLWNKWAVVQRKPWNILERVCSINPPPYPVDGLGEEDFQREIDLLSADVNVAMRDVWRFLIVVDSRETGRYSTIDITKLSDKVTADFDNLPYYITGALTPSQMRDGNSFSIGDGEVHGGYLNYPLADRSTEPRFLPEKSSFECELSWRELLLRLPWWAKITALCCLVLFLAPLLLCVYCMLFKCRSFLFRFN